MRRWLTGMRYKLQAFMQGRYGNDELSRFLSIASLVLLIVSMFDRTRISYFIACLLLIWSVFRSFSKKIYNRQAELSKYYKIKWAIKQKIKLCKSIWRDRKTHKYYKCPYCKAVVRITYPGKKREIIVNCPQCHSRFNKKT